MAPPAAFGWYHTLWFPRLLHAGCKPYHPPPAPGPGPIVNELALGIIDAEALSASATRLPSPRLTNEAAPDMILPFLAGDEIVRLSGFSPSGEQGFRLPVERPQVRARLDGAELAPIGCHVHTLAIDADAREFYLLLSARFLVGEEMTVDLSRVPRSTNSFHAARSLSTGAHSSARNGRAPKANEKGTLTMTQSNRTSFEPAQPSSGTSAGAPAPDSMPVARGQRKPSGHRVEVDASASVVRIASAEGRVELTVRCTAEGCVLQFTTAEVALSAPGKLSLECDELAVNARRHLALNTQGDWASRIDGHSVTRVAGRHQTHADESCERTAAMRWGAPTTGFASSANRSC